MKFYSMKDLKEKTKMQITEFPKISIWFTNYP